MEQDGTLNWVAETGEKDFTPVFIFILVIIYDMLTLSWLPHNYFKMKLNNK